MNLPNDPVILLSYINTQLRDNYKSLTDLCKAFNIDSSLVIDKLKTIDYEYDKSTNQFI